jgi:hypothetical protein
MNHKSRLAKLERPAKTTQARQFRPRTQAEIEKEKDESRALYSHLRMIVNGEALPSILQDATNETGVYLVKRFGTNDAAKVKADCVTLLDELEAKL